MVAGRELKPRGCMLHGVEDSGLELELSYRNGQSMDKKMETSRTWAIEEL